MRTTRLLLVRFLAFTAAIGGAYAGSRGRVPSSGFATPGVDASYDYVGKNSCLLSPHA
jgi:hypothetical protein